MKKTCIRWSLPLKVLTERPKALQTVISKGDLSAAGRAAWWGSILVNRSRRHLKDEWDRDCRDGISSARWAQQVLVGSPLCVLFPKEEPYNYNKATILYSWLPWKVCILKGRATNAHTPCWPQHTEIDQSSRGSPGRKRSEKGVDWCRQSGQRAGISPCDEHTHCTQSGKDVEGVLSEIFQIKGNLGRERVSDLKTGLHTHPANHIPRNRREGGEEKGWQLGRKREKEVQQVGEFFLSGVSVHEPHNRMCV